MADVCPHTRKTGISESFHCCSSVKRKETGEGLWETPSYIDQRGAPRRASSRNADPPWKSAAAQLLGASKKLTMDLVEIGSETKCLLTKGIVQLNI